MTAGQKKGSFFMKKNSKRLTVVILTFALIAGILPNLTPVHAETAAAAKPITEEKKDSSFDVQHFLDLYEEKALSCDQTTVNWEAMEDNLLVTAKNGDLSKASFSISKTFDFGEQTVSRVQINALAKRATKTYIKLYLDDASECLASLRIANQTREDVWTKNKVYVIDLSKKNLKLTGKHTIRFEISDTTTAADKKSSVLLRQIQFVRESIPVLSFDLDEDLSSIADMNGDSSHEPECYGDMSIHIPESYTCEFGSEKTLKATAGTYALDYIRGRGNSTWYASRKPYKLKLDKKADLFGMGENKHWVLLANYYDNSLLRNRITYFLGRELNMEYTPDCISVDVIMNDQYLGSYLLSEQVRLDKNRVDENDLEDEKYTGTDISGGYLLGMSPYSDSAENTFSTTRNTYVVESPEKGKYAKSGLEYIKNYMQETENAIYSPDFCLSDGTSYADLMDVPSAAAYYWIQEFSMNGDAYGSPSTYLYKKQDKKGQKGKLYWGPLWDFDFVAWASIEYDADNMSYVGFVNQGSWFERLPEDPSFAKELRSYWPKLKNALHKLIDKGGKLDEYRDEIAVSAKMNFDSFGFTDFGWSDDPDFPQPKLTFEQEIERLRTWITNRMNWIDENLSLLAPHEITLTYMSDGAVYEKQTAVSGRCLTLPEGPKNSDSGKIFAGWYYTVSYTDEETGETISEELRLTGEDTLFDDTVLTAKWVSKDAYTEIENIYFDRPEINVVKDMMFSVNYAVAPLDATDPSVSITSSDPKVLVPGDEPGSWYAAMPGTYELTAAAANGVTSTCTVHVIDYEDLDYDNIIFEDSFSLEQTELKLKAGEWAKLDVAASPENAIFSSNIRWLSLNPEIAAVSSGVVYALQPGTTAVLLISPYDETNICTCTITVEDGSATSPSASPVPTKIPSAAETPDRTGRKFVNGRLKYKISSNRKSSHTVFVTGAVKKTYSKLTIPHYVTWKKQKYTVTGIAPRAFANQKKLKKVTIGKGITTIGNGSFYKCRMLSSVNILSRQLRYVGIRSFTGINKKARCYVPKGKKSAYRKFFGKRMR